MAQPDMHGRICLVTGGSSGIGKETALGLAKMGAHVVLVARSSSRGEAARAEIRSKSDNDQIDLPLADLSAQQSIRRLADEVTSRYDHLDVLVNNAGVINPSRRVSEDGIELTLALNHLAYFLLTNLLLDLLNASSPARVVNVSSDAHKSAHIDFDDLQLAKRYRPNRAYGQSKLANIMFTYELARRLQGKGSGVTSNCLHPGFVASRFGRQEPGLLNVGMRIAHLFAISPAEGAETSIYLASTPDVKGVSGKYFVKRKETRSSKESYDEAESRRLWDVSAELTHLGELASA